MYRNLILAIFAGLCVSSGADAQEWAQKMFKARTHDFGTVARNAKSEFYFELENPYAVDVHVSGVRTSCGCATPKIINESLTTYEKGAILAVYNTDKFLGKRGATVTVTFDKPSYAEVQLTIKGYIRSDVLIEPGGVDFGSVNHGTAVEKVARIRYYGTRQWRIQEIRSSNPHVKTELMPRPDRSGRTAYDLVARLETDAPVGYFTDQLTLVTNDRDSPLVPVNVQGRVVSPVTVSPSSIFLGVVRPQQEVRKNLIVRGNVPFRVTAITAEGENFQFKVGESPKKIHVIPMSFTAGSTTTKVDSVITVQTDLGEGVDTTCRAMAAVVANEVASN